MSALQEIAVDLEAERVSEDEHPHQIDARKSVFSAFFEWFGALSIGRKIKVFYFLNLALAILGGLVVLVAYFQLGDRARDIAVQHDHAMNAERLVAVISEAHRNSEMYVARGEVARSADAIEQLQIADEKLAELRASGLSSDLASFDRLSLIEAGVEDFRRQIRALDADRISAARREDQATEMQATGELVLKAAKDLAQRLSAKATALTESGQAQIDSLPIIFVLVVGVLTCVTLFAQRYFDRHVGGSIKAMTKEMKMLASGNSDFTISGRQRKDEIGDMARAMGVFHRAGKRLEAMSRERAAKAKAELEAQAQLQKEQEELRFERKRALRDVADQFERTVGEVVTGVAEASSQLQTTSRMMAQTAEESSQRVNVVSASMTDANSGATAAAAASDEFAMSINEISRQAASSAELARKATDSAHDADSTISALSDSAQQVGQIVELIQTIAQRTNLLALNASIEAARGGEAGRGFAVVASEVKELAMQTSRATEQVAEQIRAVQDTTGASVNALRSIADQIQELESTAVSIASAVDQQSVAGQDLARSIDLAARGTEQVSSHIADVRDLSLNTGSAASQVLSSATNLEGQSAVLSEQVNAFLAKVRHS